MGEIISLLNLFSVCRVSEQMFVSRCFHSPAETGKPAAELVVHFDRFVDERGLIRHSSSASSSPRTRIRDCFSITGHYGEVVPPISLAVLP